MATEGPGGSVTSIIITVICVSRLQIIANLNTQLIISTQLLWIGSISACPQSGHNIVCHSAFHKIPSEKCLQPLKARWKPWLNFPRSLSENAASTIPLIPLSVVFYESDFGNTTALFRGIVIQVQEQGATGFQTINRQVSTEGDILENPVYVPPRRTNDMEGTNQSHTPAYFVPIKVCVNHWSFYFPSGMT